MAAGDVRHFNGTRNVADGGAALSSASLLNLAGTANIRIKVNSGTLRVGLTGSVSATSGLALNPVGLPNSDSGILDMPDVVVANMAIFAQNDNVNFEVLATYTA